MRMDDINFGFSSSCPNQDGMQVCKRVFVYHDLGWDIFIVNFNLSSVDK